MKQPVFALLLASAMFAPLSHAAPQAGWDVEVRKFDDAYWAAYNRCDIKALGAMNADDLEFYHDLGGVMRGKAPFDAAMAQNICGNPSSKVRREAVAGTVHIYPMMAAGVLYGAVIEGAHQFYRGAPGAPGMLEDKARFTSLLLFKDGAWKLARALSYDHVSVQAAARPVEVQAPAQALSLLAGTYTAKDKMVLTVQPAGGHLIVTAGGSTFELYPTGANNFAMKQRAIEVRFTVDANGKGQGLVVLERGVIVAEATFTGA